jgi:S-(hydroxymethyl)glutathione dehydrogenase/alcohol dehydrogenase
MKAAVITPSQGMQVWDIEHQILDGYSRTCANGQVRVKILSSGICGAQIKELDGERGTEFRPNLCGHEGCGIIEEVGAGVNLQMIGKKCVLHWRKGAGPESYLPARYEAAGGVTLGGGHVTTLCEQAVVSANRVTVVPDDIPDELCALLGCGLSTALGTIEQEAKVKFGESVLIVGCGGVGLNLIQAAKLACAYPIVGMDISDEKRTSVEFLGAHKYLNAKKELAKDSLFAYGLKGFDVIVDTTGSIEALEATIQLLAPTGRLVMVGQPKPGEAFRVLNALDMFHGEGKHIMATQGGGFRPSEMIPRYCNLWRAGHLNIEGIVSHRIGLENINEGIELVRAGQAGRIMVMMK